MEDEWRCERVEISTSSFSLTSEQQRPAEGIRLGYGLLCLLGRVYLDQTLPGSQPLVPMTLHRRFLLAPSLARLIQRERGGLRQVEGFFPEQNDRSAWVRLEENRGLLLLRISGPQGDTEEETEVPVAHAHALLDVCAGEIDYTRTRLRVGDHEVLIDQVNRPRILHLATVAFDTEAQAQGFAPLVWFGPEVTEEARYTPRALALGEVPQTAEIPLSNAALAGLLDTLENRAPAAARQVPVTRASAGPSPAGGQSVAVNLDEIEAAMLAEVTRRLPNSWN